MKDEDMVAIAKFLDRHPELEPERVLGLSSGDEERELVHARWPWALLHELGIRNWNLYGPPPIDVSGDLAIACNTFMCSGDPKAWLRNLALAVPLLIVQDLSVARRGHEGRYTDPVSGDVARYSISSHGIVGQTDERLEVFDLSTSGHEVLDVVDYGPGKFVALIRLRR